ncbi:LysR substrate-binding domain-containing protein [Pleionea sp. CnH1-48]|uniref:LysR substrate-binding domain-containing protein n=1 Tax=Pleionea sp. CnH1-48 TaxID=2954494 RepID=UPI0020968B70|nr:LysR substrate-binding domain-containing protein [Pleionea sp. CnH1-48]MCO7227069.1 LysR substrate-binding domain-containing protein [Pleionea sp. CnH1-48]
MTTKRTPPLKAIQAFEATARHLSFSKAAEELCVTQSAVSHQLKVLEDFFGKPLLIRKGKRIALTQDGDDFLSVVGDCFQRIASVTNHILEQQTVHLKVMAQTSIATEWLAPQITEFKQSYPDISIMLNMETFAANFVANDYDIILGTWPTPDGFVTQTLTDEEWFPVCTPALYRKIDERDPESITQQILNTSENGEDWNLWMQHQQIRRPTHLDFQYFSLALLATKAALGGQSIALSNRFIAGEFMATGRLKAIESMSYPLPWGNYHIHYRSDSHRSQPINDFIDWIKSTMKYL